MGEQTKVKTIRLASNYLRYKSPVPEELTKELRQAFDEVKENSNFKSVHRIFEWNDGEITGSTILVNQRGSDNISEDFSVYMRGCSGIMLIASTLGVELERFLRKQQLLNMSHAVVIDATASAYLEIMRDEYVDSLGLEAHTFCFAPGYGDIPLSLNRDIVNVLQADKHIGITVSESNLFIPQKSIASFSGIGYELKEKTCRNCVRMNCCALRKENMTCYSV